MHVRTILNKLLNVESVFFRLSRYVTTGDSGKTGPKKIFTLFQKLYEHSSIKVRRRRYCRMTGRVLHTLYACGWKDDDKIKKLPAFLQGQAATHFYATPAEETAT